MGEASVTLNHPARGVLQVLRRQGSEARHTEDHDDRIHTRNNVRPVVTGNLDFGVDMECDTREGIRRKTLAGLPNGDTRNYVLSILANSREVVLGDVVDSCLQFENRVPVVISVGSEITERGIIVKIFSIWRE